MYPCFPLHCPAYASLTAAAGLQALTPYSVGLCNIVQHNTMQCCVVAALVMSICYAMQAIAYTAPVASPASSPPIYGGYHSSPAPASPFSPMASPASPLFGIQSNSAAYSPAQVASPRAVAYSPAPGGYYSPAAQRSPRAGATPLFGTPTPSPPPTQLTQYSPPAPYLPQGYGAAPSSPALTPRFTPKPYYTITAGEAHSLKAELTVYSALHMMQLQSS